jgi:hypothetical protein
MSKIFICNVQIKRIGILSSPPPNFVAYSRNLVVLSTLNFILYSSLDLSQQRGASPGTTDSSIYPLKIKFIYFGLHPFFFIPSLGVEKIK